MLGWSAVARAQIGIRIGWTLLWRLVLVGRLGRVLLFVAAFGEAGLDLVEELAGIDAEFRRGARAGDGDRNLDAGAVPAAGPTGPTARLTLYEARDRFERDLILKTLAEQHGNMSRTAEALGVDVPILVEQTPPEEMLPLEETDET